MDTEAFTANLIELPSVPILKTGTSAEVWDLVPLDKNSKPVQTKILPKIFIAIPPPDGCSPVPENRYLAIDRIVIGEAKNYTCLKRQVFPSDCIRMPTPLDPSKLWLLNDHRLGKKGVGHDDYRHR